MSFIKKVFGKISDLRPAQTDEDDSLLEDETDADAGKKKRVGTMPDDAFGTPKAKETVKYSPTMALESSGYGATPTFTAPKAGGQVKSFTPERVTASAPAAPTAPTASAATQPNVFDIKAVRRPKYKLSFLTLRDMFDVKTVANHMINNDTIVVVDLDGLDITDRRRAMDFLDGAKYVAGSVNVKFTDGIYAYIPQDVELQGDFYDQVEIASLAQRKS